MPFTVRPYAPADAAEWDALVAASPSGTFLHSRAFLGYHGDRFADRSVVVRDGGDRLVAVLPAALAPGDPRTVVSHPGATFGGLVRAPGLYGEACAEALALVATRYGESGLERLVYKPVPQVFQRTPDQDDVYALSRLGVSVARCELSAVVDVTLPAAYRKGRRYGLSLAARAGLTVARGIDRAAEFWPLLEAGLAERHGARPVHSVAELLDVAARCPGRVDVAVAREGGEPVAGAVLFELGSAVHTQYLMSSPRGREVGGLDLVIHSVLSAAREEGRRWVSFGTSNEEGGRVLNGGLYEFKRGFGAGGVAVPTFEIPLRRGSSAEDRHA